MLSRISGSMIGSEKGNWGELIPPPQGWDRHVSSQNVLSVYAFGMGSQIITSVMSKHTLASYSGNRV
jgi:hypothetical protein